MPAVKMPDELYDLLAPRHDSSYSHGHQGRFGTAIGEPQPLSRRNHFLNSLAPFEFKFMAGGIVRSQGHLPLHSFDNRRIPVPQQ